MFYLFFCILISIIGWLVKKRHHSDYFIHFSFLSLFLLGICNAGHSGSMMINDQNTKHPNVQMNQFHRHGADDQLTSSNQIDKGTSPKTFLTKTQFAHLTS
ncbi:uncharacterized protein LOC141855686 [Brevipalpus obovatus]|uniref:uncharacterized protein LOC141855686 n=1 Tax=Brevipalpus obovatus TaxID=246614 RepID=UPI003D9DC5EE